MRTEPSLTLTPCNPEMPPMSITNSGRASRNRISGNQAVSAGQQFGVWVVGQQLHGFRYRAGLSVFKLCCKHCNQSSLIQRRLVVVAVAVIMPMIVSVPVVVPALLYGAPDPLGRQGHVQLGYAQRFEGRP